MLHFTVYLDMHKRKTLSYDKPENRLPVEAEMTNHVFLWVKYYISRVSAFSIGFFAPQSITVTLCQLMSQGASLQKKDQKTNMTYPWVVSVHCCPLSSLYI